MNRKTMTLKMTDEQLNALRDIAKHYGFIMERGPLVGGGSVQQMLEAVADGEYHLSIWKNGNTN